MAKNSTTSGASFPVVEVDGIDETRRAIRNLDRDATRELRAVNKQMMSGLIVKVRTTAAIYGPQASLAVSKLAAKSDRYPAMSVGTRKRARRSSGGKDRPTIADVFWGAEFGSHRFPQFPRRQPKGRFLWPNVKVAERETVKRWQATVDDLTEDIVR